MTSAIAADADAEASTSEEHRRVNKDTILQDMIVTSRKNSIIADDLISTMSAVSASMKATRTKGARMSAAPFLLAASMKRLKKKLMSKQKNKTTNHTNDDSPNNGVM